MMKKQTKNILITSLLALFGPSVLASSHLFWDNEEGLVKASANCEVAAAQETPFRVSRYFGSGDSKTENLRNHAGVKQSNLINFSLLKKIEGASKRNHERLEVVGLNDGMGLEKSRWNSQRGDKGYLFHESTLPAEDFVFQIKADAFVKKTDQSVVDGINNLKSTEDLYVRIAADSNYYQYKCGDSERTYSAFRVYQKGHGETPLFYLGVSASETSVFSSLTSLAKTSAMSFLSDVGHEQPISIDGGVPTSGEAIAKAELEPQMDGTTGKTIEEDIELAQSSQTEKEAGPGAQEEVLSSLERVTCMGSRTLNIRSEDLETVLFKATVGEPVKVFQSWGEESLKRTIGGVEYNFVKVEFSERESSDEKVGYVADSFIKEKEKCGHLRKVRREDMASVEIKGIDDGKCCDFPTIEKPTHSYTSGMRRFNAGRSGGRRHAACDLYRYKDEPIRAIAAGKVLTDLYYFYQGTFALEVKHSGGFVARYGELTGKKAKNIRKNRTVVMGQRLGYIGKVNSGCCRPMLHFELFKGTKRGSLSTSSGRFRRRSDLLNPTEYLLRWEDDVF